MEKKICSKCGELKLFCDFTKDRSKKTGYKSQCKVCIHEKQKIYKKENSEKISIERRKYYLKNIDREKNNKITYEKNNKDKLKEYRKNRYKTNQMYRLKVNVRRRINVYLKNKNTSSIDILGCNLVDFKIYLESKFIDGMCWDNYGKFGWHIDHKIPLSSARNEEELYKLCHYSNLQPLWWYDNLRKSTQILE